MLPSRNLLLCIALGCFCFGCQDDDDFVDAELSNPGLPQDVPGLYYGEEKDGDFAVLYDSLLTLMDASDLVSVVGEVDHVGNAAAVGITLRPTRLVLFSSPSQLTPLLQANPLAGLDFPQKTLVYEAEDGDVFMISDGSQYYGSRYDIGDVPGLAGMSSTVFNLIRRSGITGEILPSGDLSVERGIGITTRTAAGSVDSVYTALRAAIAANTNLTIVTEVDHRADAATVNMDLPPNRVIVFGNPNLGSPLLREAQTMGVDLPQKMLVYQSAPGEVTVAYNDPYYLARRHGLDESLPELATIATALENLARTALGG